MKTYDEAVEFVAEVRAQMLAFPNAPMGTYIPEAALAEVYGRDPEVVYTDCQMATLARRQLTAA